MSPRRGSFWKSGTNVSAVVGVIAVIVNHFGWVEVTEATANAFVMVALFVSQIFQRLAMQRIEEKAHTAASAALAAEVQTSPAAEAARAERAGEREAEGEP